MNPTDSTIQAAVQLHRTGHLEQAIARYQEILAKTPDHPDALHLLGVAHHQSGNHDTAVESIRRAIELNPRAEMFYANLGAAYRASGRIEEAIANYRTALKMFPANPVLHNNLGIALMKQSDYAGAENCFRRATELKPSYLEALNNLGRAYTSLKRWSDAREVLQRALRSKPDYADALLNLAAVWNSLGDLEAGHKCLLKVLEIRPGDLKAQFNLANTLRRMGESEAAVQAYERVIESQTDHLDAHINLSLALKDYGDMEAALAVSRTAVSLAPDNLDAQGNLAAIVLESGDFEEARRLYREIIRVDPSRANAYNMIASPGAGSLTDEEIQDLESIVADPSSDSDSIMHAHFALGRWCDKKGQYDQAFTHFEQANRLQATPFDTDGFVRLVDAVMEVFCEDYFRRHTTNGNPTRRPVFIVGMPRSGTTLVEQILSSHPHVAGGGELTEITHLTVRTQRIIEPKAKYPHSVLHLSEEQWQQLGERYLKRLKRVDEITERVTDKLPGNFVQLGFIATLFPNASIVHCQRDPLDVCLSCFMQPFVQVEYASDLTVLAYYYREYQRLMEHWRRVLPLNLLDVRYETLVSDQSGMSRRMMEHVGLEWDDCCLQFHKTERPIQTASTWQVRQPIYTSSVAKWKYYEKHLQPLMEILGTGSDSA